jgi:hypothetical protein
MYASMIYAYAEINQNVTGKRGVAARWDAM